MITDAMAIRLARTPNIDRLAESGLRFDNAFLTASSCSPSRASIVTGRYPHNTGKAAELHLPIAQSFAVVSRTTSRVGVLHCLVWQESHVSGAARF